MEGSGRIGGRIKSIEWEGATIELGAQWITGCSTANPIYQLGVKNLNLAGIQDETYAFRCCQTGKDITVDGLKKMEEFD